MRLAAHKLVRPWRILRDQGPRVFLGRSFAKVGSLLAGTPSRLLVARSDAIAVDWTAPPEQLSSPISVGAGPIEIAWITSPPGAESGGHQNLFRFIKFAEDAGHSSTIYLYDQSGHSISDVRSMLNASSAYPDLHARIVPYRRDVGVAEGTQAIFATGWETAYPAFRDVSHARRFYFVQDFEPMFYAIGTQSVLAENTYRFGFHGITAGKWLAEKLRSDFGMATDYFDFGVDTATYHLENREPRNEIFFYARPVTARRAFEFGVLALSEFARLRPDVTVNFVGWNVAGENIPFPHKNLASLDISKLNAVYNRCAAGLVLSLTNLSLLPLELMSSGTTPVINDAPNNRLVVDSPYIEWVTMSPAAIARRLVAVLEREDAVDRSVKMAESMRHIDWNNSGRQFLAAFEGAMRG